MKAILLFSVFLFFVAQVLWAQQPDVVFHRITEKDGLSYNNVNCFLKDKKGMLWIGTYDGLDRFDGKHFYTYKTGIEKNSLPNNSVHELIEDNKGNIWGGTDNGIFCLNTATGKFKRYGTPGQKEWPAVYNLCYDAEGKIWATNDFCLSVYNEKTDQFEQPPTQGSYPEGMILKNGLEESPDGKGLWLTTRKGLQYYSKAEKRFITAANSSNSTLFTNHSVSALCATKYGHYWFTDNNTASVKGFDPLTQKIKYDINLKHLNPLTTGATLFEDQNHILWLCTWRYELYMIDYRNNNKITRIRYNKSDITSIAGDFFWTVMQEPDGTLWFGTVGGISKCNLSRSFYRTHSVPAAVAETDKSFILYVAENKHDQTWWYASKENLINYNPVTKASKILPFSKFKKNNQQNTPGHVNKMLFLKDSILIFDDHGIWMRKGESAFTPIEMKQARTDPAIKDAVLYEDAYIYAITPNYLLKWNLQTGWLDTINNYSGLLAKNKTLVYEKIQIADNKIWIITKQGKLLCYDNRELTIIPMNYRDNDELVDGLYTSMTTDSIGALWIVKKGDGLIHFKTGTKTGRLLKQQDGLVMDHIMAVTEDKQRRIWTGCFNKFSIYNPAYNSFYNFTLPLSDNNYDYINSLVTLSSGNIIGNVGNYLVEFFPERLRPSKVNHKPLISMFSINGLDTNLFYNNSLLLQPHENSFRVKFGMLTDDVVSPYDMMYILEGAESNYTTVSSSFEAGYNSLQPGSYTFKVKAVAKDKSWQTEETSLKIKIATPFYKTTWFLLLMGIVGAALIALVYRLRIHQRERVMLLENKAQLLEKEKTLVMYESLKQQLNPHFLFNSLTSLSGLIETDQSEAVEFLEQMSGIYRYILKNGNNETVLLKDEIKFVQLYINLQQTRFKNGLQVNIHVPEEYHHYKIAPVTLQNLIENAIKHNIIDINNPLQVAIYIENDSLVVRNNLQKKNMVETSNKKGLVQFVNLYSYLSLKPVVITEDKKYFTVTIPLI